ncbi:DUF3267 domain-containing protein [Flammeovirga sp. EKP202]|uniref:DUF3267 domain-containing protein n=1 Tax=Flammeovirga sp. EKP202 TaxID=2770592 RepID=UPI00165F8768|nr:DUF3267 domain-containing protein [Flammeovirga sp. EKP202]MBD0403711.1 DUF3267 domain-containing protein [Flammeovirga sp. EKP202]
MLELENYKKEKLTINLSWANIFGILILIPIGFVFGVPFFIIWKPQIDVGDFLSNMGPEGSELGMVSVLFILILGIVVHELIHGISWAIFAKKGFKSIKFGVLWKALTPYCHCKEPLYVRQYIIGAITPALFLGILPSLVAIMIGDFGLLLFGMFFTMAAGGDFLVINLIRKENSSDLVQDHPSEAGCYIYRQHQAKK